MNLATVVPISSEPSWKETLGVVGIKAGRYDEFLGQWQYL